MGHPFSPYKAGADQSPLFEPATPPHPNPPRPGALGVEEADLQQLRQERFLSDGDQLPDLLRNGKADSEALARNCPSTLPLRRSVHPAAQPPGAGMSEMPPKQPVPANLL